MLYGFSQADIATLPQVLSQPRFATYLVARNNSALDALRLYQWNAQVSAAFLFPIHIFEICTRNAVANAAESHYGVTWPWVRVFELSLPDRRFPHFSPRREIVNTRGRHPTTGKVIADMKFAFWVSMFTSRHDIRLWQPYMAREFPNLPPGTTVQFARGRVNQVAETVRELSNRIAHHEPVFTRNLAEHFAGIVEIVGYRCRQTTNWMSRCETISALLALQP